MAGRIIQPGDIPLIQQRLDEGISLRKIGTEVHVSRTTILNIKKGRHGLVRKRTPWSAARGAARRPRYELARGPASLGDEQMVRNDAEQQGRLARRGRWHPVPPDLLATRGRFAAGRFLYKHQGLYLRSTPSATDDQKEAWTERYVGWYTAEYTKGVGARAKRPRSPAKG